jgi:macrolide phosphotransferase
MSEPPIPARGGKPWEADHEMDVTRVEALIAAEMPDLLGRRVTFLGEGWDFRVFDVEGELLRFPKRADCTVAMGREARLLEFLAPRLPVEVPRPVVHSVAIHAPHGFERLRRLPGRALSEVTVDAVHARRIAASLGSLACAIHAVGGAEAAALGVPDSGWEAPATRARRAVARLRDVAPHLPRLVAGAARRYLERSAPPAGAGETPLTHSDIWPEHLMVGDALELRGLIDWTDAERGDPARDLAGAWYVGGDQGLGAALERYEQPWGAGLRDRARFFGVDQAVGDAWYGLQRGLDLPVAQASAALARLE